MIFHYDINNITFLRQQTIFEIAWRLADDTSSSGAYSLELQHTIACFYKLLKKL